MDDPSAARWCTVELKSIYFRCWIIGVYENIKKIQICLKYSRKKKVLAVSQNGPRPVHYWPRFRHFFVRAYDLFWSQLSTWMEPIVTCTAVGDVPSLACVTWSHENGLKQISGQFGPWHLPGGCQRTCCTGRKSPILNITNYGDRFKANSHAAENTDRLPWQRLRCWLSTHQHRSRLNRWSSASAD